MKNLKTKLSFVILISFISAIAYCQIEKSKVIENVSGSSTATTFNSVEGPAPGVTRDPQLERQIREQRLLGNKTAVENLQNELVTKYKIRQSNEEVKQVKPVRGNLFNSESDLLNRTNITLIDSISYITTHGAVSEQLGNNIGRIWNVYIVATPVKDTIKVWYSDDNGINWNLFAAYLWAFPDFDTYASGIDVDIVINPSTNDKMLYVIANTYYNSNYCFNVIKVNVGNNPGFSTQMLFNYMVPAGHVLAVSVATDNATYNSLPYVYICGYEFYYNTFLGDYVWILKYSVITNPFDEGCVLNYLYGGLKHELGVPQRYLDFCVFYYANSDNIIFSDGSIGNSSMHIKCYQLNIYDALTGGTGVAISLGNGINKLNYPSIASDGTNIMLAATYRYSSTDNDIIYFKSSSGITGFNTSGFIDNSVLVEELPVVKAKYSGNGKFLCAYIKRSGTYASIYLSSSENYSWNRWSKMISNTEMSWFEGFSTPIPAVTRDNECFVTWEDYGYDQMIYSSTGCSGEITRTKSLTLKTFIEGFYIPSSNQNRTHDTVKVYLRSYSSPYNIVDSTKNPVNKSGMTISNFTNAENNVKYFIVVKHRNSIETWSHPDGVKFTNDHLNFDFTLSNGQSYGANQKQVDQTPITYAFFSGDVNQDGVIDATDAGSVDNDAYNFVTGYKNTDLTGDNVTDASDASLVDNNAYNFVSAIRP